MDKVIVITGGGRGIGAATALLAAERGYRICINYQSDESAAQSVLDLQQSRLIASVQLIAALGGGWDGAL